MCIRDRFYANQSIYKDGRLAIGRIYDVNGTLLAENKGGTVEYSEDESIRRATLHAVGDMDGNIATSAESAFKSQLVGYNLLTGTYSVTGRDVYKRQAWYDNEMSYTSQLIRTLRHMGRMGM